MVRLLEIQEKLKIELTQAVENSDSAELNRLILKAEKLEMGTEPQVMQAKEVSFHDMLMGLFYCLFESSLCFSE